MSEQAAINDVVKQARTLADAIVDTVHEPLVVLDRDLRVVAASRSFYQTFDVLPDDTQGRLFYELANGQWEIPALRKLLEEVIPRHRIVTAYEIEHDFASVGRRTLLLNARQVFDEANPNTALLLAIEDVTGRRTAEREKDDLLREKEMLLEEMRHRVANSLQIIASILLLKARTVQSEETRRHLQDAHQRVMSVATVQEQLRGTGHGDRIEIGPVPDEALRQPRQIDDRDRAVYYCSRGGWCRLCRLRRRGEPWSDRDGASDQRRQARLSGRPIRHDTRQVRLGRIRVAALRV